MGHVESGGAPSEAPVTEASVTEHASWPVWRALTAEFKTSRLLRAAFGSGAGWGLYGVDLASSLRQTPMAKAAMAMLASVDDKTLADLTAIAEVNAQRNDAMWRLAIMFYVTVPATIVIAGIDAAPQIVEEVIRPLALMLVILLPALTIQLLFYFATQWRARQIVGVLRFAWIERGRPGGAPV